MICPKFAVLHGTRLRLYPKLELDTRKYKHLSTSAEIFVPLCPEAYFLNLVWTTVLQTGIHNAMYFTGLIDFGADDNDTIVIESRSKRQVFQLGYTGMRLLVVDGIRILQMYNINKQDIKGQVKLD